ncbi:hypothetical protein DSL72_006822 [Monilinia vaccinii-corymbosi]|uniref:Anaphase-promoting complex subunit 4 WD40 domain-containing protein n=1 Tax=Monilinia vaccinii-corymbosi TaxID=61207 RepID=A0A8A3PKR5_9HELO|nr:hypothetical protein DSL72_006822 [Monilinia vaccinii-corymbosi]
MTWKLGNGEWEFPKLREAHQFSNLPRGNHASNGSSGKMDDFWSVKFYPYTKPGVDPIYAVVGGKHILICRPPAEQKGIEVIQFIVDGDPSADHYTCCWTKDLTTKHPLLCVAGADAKIKIFDVLSGKVVRVLAGHGGEIDELAISPINPHILASCSMDSTIRIWSLDPKNEDFPCAAILSGGHRDTVTTIDFHHSGRYLISGGVDLTICLWTLPIFLDENTGTKMATQIQYPHFASCDIHTGAVDCVRFYDDSILSRSANENSIVLWEITGFDSKGPIPDQNQAPTQHEPANGSSSLTCFTDPSRFESYTRIIEFSAPETETFWMRFSLFQGLPIPSTPTTSPYPNPSPNTTQNPSTSSTDRTHPILAIASHTSKVYFWDLTRLTSYYDYVHSLPPSLTSKAEANPSHSYSTILGLRSGEQTPASEEQPCRPPFLNPKRSRGRGGSSCLSTKSATSRLRDVSPASSSTTTTSISNPSLNTNASSNVSDPSLSRSLASSPSNATTIIKTPTTRRDVEHWNAK